MLSRQTAFPDNGDGNNGLKAVFGLDHAGAPHGLPERVTTLSHKIGVFSPRVRWRLGGLLLLHNHGVSGGSSMMIPEYDKKNKIFGIEALGQDAVHTQAMQLVISALYHVAHDFPGASWMGWMGCGMSHDGERMYLLATSNEKQARTYFRFCSPAKAVHIDRSRSRRVFGGGSRFPLSLPLLGR